MWSTSKCCSWNSDEFTLFAVYPSDNIVVRNVMTELPAATLFTQAHYNSVGYRLKVSFNTLYYATLLFPYRWAVGAAVEQHWMLAALSVVRIVHTQLLNLCPSIKYVACLIKEVMMSSPFRRLPIRPKWAAENVTNWTNRESCQTMWLPFPIETNDAYYV